MPATVVQNIEQKFNITSCVHPHYAAHSNEWRKWRLTYEGGDRFIRQYLEQFSNREDHKEFQQRRKISYCPAFAKSALKKVRNTVFSRSRDITREGGPRSYQVAIAGKENGVDLAGSSMNYFMGVEVLQELLKMKCVGVYVDMPRLQGPTLLEKGKARPYCYIYQAEDIRSWTYDPDNPSEFTSVLLIDHDYDYEDETGLPKGETRRYRFLYLKDTEEGRRLFVRFYNEKNEQQDSFGNPVLERYDLPDFEEPVGTLDRVPFHLLDIGTSLLADVANYQIAHLNIASGDVWYAARANFPFYVESYDPRATSPYVRQESEDDYSSFEASSTTTTTTHSSEVTIGPTRGRKYPTGTDAPSFIHPSPEPLTASMAKQEQMKEEIKELIAQTLENLTGTTENNEILSGLNYISYVLQRAENRIALFWSLYEGKNDPAIVIYPDEVQIETPKDVQAEVANLLLLIDKVPQLTFKKELLKQVARLKLAPKIDKETLTKIQKEIDKSTVILGDPVNVVADVTAGLVSLETAAISRGYPEDEAKKAADDHAERLKRIQDAQTPRNPDGSLIETAQARGLTDLSGDMHAGKKEKASVRDTTHAGNQDSLTRGDGKAPNA